MWGQGARKRGRGQGARKLAGAREAVGQCQQGANGASKPVAGTPVGQSSKVLWSQEASKVLWSQEANKEPGS